MTILIVVIWDYRGVEIKLISLWDSSKFDITYPANPTASQKQLEYEFLNKAKHPTTRGVPRNFVRGGGAVQQIQLRTEDRQKGDLGTVNP